MWQFWLVTGALLLGQGGEAATLQTTAHGAAVGVPQMHAFAGLGAFQAHCSLSVPFQRQPLL